MVHFFTYHNAGLACLGLILVKFYNQYVDEILGKIRKYIVLFSKKLKNWCFRPKLNFSFETKNIKFFDSNNKEYVYPYFCLCLINQSKKSHSLKLNNLCINFERYQPLLYEDKNFSKLSKESKEPWKDCENDIFKIFINNWMSIHSGDYAFELIPNKKFIFPLKNSTIITRQQREHLLFRKNDINISIQLANGKKYEYGVKNEESCKVLISQLDINNRRFS